MLQGPIDDAAFGHYVLPLLQQAPPVPTKDV